MDLKFENFIVIKLNTSEDVKRLVKAASKCLGNVFASSKKSRVNAKSVMGVLSISMSEPVKITTESSADLKVLIDELGPHFNIESFSFVV